MLRVGGCELVAVSVVADVGGCFHQGIWTWSVPATVDGGAFAVLFLDTEGFGASDVTAGTLL